MNTNRTKGHNLERRVVNDILPYFPNAKTARYASREQDDKGIDLVGTSPLAIQCKNYKVKPNFKDVFDHMDTDEIKVLVFKWNKIRGNDGEFAVLPYKDFLKFLEMFI